MGRPRKPSWKRKLEGNRSLSPIPPDMARNVRGLPVPPAHWDDERKLEYMILCEQLDACGALTKLDGAGLEQLIDGIFDYRRAGRMLSEEGYISGDRGEKVSPWWRIRCDAATKVLRLLREYGMTPSGRASLGGLADGQPEADQAENKHFGLTG